MEFETTVSLCPRNSRLVSDLSIKKELHKVFTHKLITSKQEKDVDLFQVGSFPVTTHI